MSEVAVSVAIARINSGSTAENGKSGKSRKSGNKSNDVPVSHHHDRSSSFDYTNSCQSSGSSPTIKISKIDSNDDPYLSPVHFKHQINSSNPFLTTSTTASNVNYMKNGPASNKQRSKSANLAEDYFYKYSNNHLRIRFDSPENDKVTNNSPGLTNNVHSNSTSNVVSPKSNVLSPNMRSFCSSSVSKYSSEPGSPSGSSYAHHHYDQDSSVRLTDDDDWSDYVKNEDLNLSSRNESEQDQDEDDENLDTKQAKSKFYSRRNSSRESGKSRSPSNLAASSLARLSSSLRESRTRVKKKLASSNVNINIITSSSSRPPPKILVDDHFYEEAMNFGRPRIDPSRCKSGNEGDDDSSMSNTPSPPPPITYGFQVPLSPTSHHSSLASTRVVTPSASPGTQTPSPSSPKSHPSHLFPLITITTAQATFNEDGDCNLDKKYNYHKLPTTNYYIDDISPKNNCGFDAKSPDDEETIFPRSYSHPPPAAFNGTRPKSLPYVLQRSLFPNVSPTFYFVADGEEVIQLPEELASHLKWKLSSITPGLIKETVCRSGFKLIKEKTGSPKWLGTWCKHLKSNDFSPITTYNKVNHFPGSFHLGRKDKLWYNLQDKSFKYGSSAFSHFHPTTYVLPHDLKLLRRSWINTSAVSEWRMILKPPASARGNGIHVINKWSQIPKSVKVRKRHSSKALLIAQEYISNPCLLFNGAKFDLRIYVLITSFHPLKIYMFNDGLVRFASSKYSRSPSSLSDPFVHLTNYSINKTNDKYQSNNDATSRTGHKWTLSTLWRHLRENEPNVNVDHLQKQIIDMIIKTMISCEESVNKLINKHLSSRYTSFELLGFDVMIDEHFKPWLLEVNISPSLRAESDLDNEIKGLLIKDLLNLVGYRLPSYALKHFTRSSSVQKVISGTNSHLPRSEVKTHDQDYRLKDNLDDEKFFSSKLTKCEQAKHEKFEKEVSQDNFGAILNNLTPDDVRILMETEDEFSRRGHFSRIFPNSPSTDVYMKYFDERRYYNILLLAWEHKYPGDKKHEGLELLKSLAAEKYHLKERTNCEEDENVFDDEAATDKAPILE